MPLRFLRPGLTDSDRFNRASWFDQSLLVRLFTVVDDYGRYDARPELVRAHCFPLHGELTVAEVGAGLQRLHGLILLKLYTVGGKPYLQIETWVEKARSKSKYPAPTDDEPQPELNYAAGNGAQAAGSCTHLHATARNCAQMLASASNCLPPSPSSTPSSTPAPSPPPSPLSMSARTPTLTRNRADPKPIAGYVADEILRREPEWSWDNCRVHAERIQPKSLLAVIEPLLTAGLRSDQLLDTWPKAVRRAHKASVDGLAAQPEAYAIGCWRDLLNTGAAPNTQVSEPPHKNP